MMKNKIFGYVMTGALSLGVIGGTAHAFAATETDTVAAPAVEQAVNVKASLDEATKEKVQAIMDDLKSNLATIGVELPAKGDHGPRGDFLADLDDATKEKAQSILAQEKEGTITREEAQSQMTELGVELPAKGDHGPRGDFLAELDEATKEKAQSILDQEKEGTITREEARNQLTELGVELPAKGDHGPRGDFLADLDEATKEKAQAILDQEKAGTITREEALSQLTELGVELPAKGDRGPRGDFLADLDDATKEKAQDFIDDAEAQLAELGVDHLPKGLKKIL